jgi:hypothetical protein
MSPYPYMKLVLTAAILIVFPSLVSGSAQETYKITGVVLNRETNDPVPLAEVFISGTTHGSITDTEGRFELETGYLPCQLVVSHLSYAPFNRMIDVESLTYLTIRLIPYQHEITEIAVESISRRKENLELFKRAFIGEDDIAYACKILNDSILSFRWDSLVFSASARQPLLIDNPKLGYRIKIILEDFKLIYQPEDYRKIHRGRKIKPDVTGALYQTICQFHFIPHPPGKGSQQKRIENNRLRTYYGSRMHFLRALYSDQLKSYGYRINPGYQSFPITDARILDSSSGIKIIFLDPLGYPDKMLILPDKPVEISFFEDYSGKPVNLNKENGMHVSPLKSRLTFSKNKCMVRYNGTTFDYSLVFYGDLGGQRIASMLPDDFKPDHEYSYY